jgi:hypothetical protein
MSFNISIRWSRRHALQPAADRFYGRAKEPIVGPSADTKTPTAKGGFSIIEKEPPPRLQPGLEWRPNLSSEQAYFRLT